MDGRSSSQTTDLRPNPDAAARRVPASPEDLTPAWLTSALASTGVIDGASVVSADASALGRGNGLIGSLYRLHLTYDRADEDAPASLIAKLAAPPGPVRELATRFGMYRREVAFYHDLAPRVGLPTPRLYFAAADDADEMVLLLEDVSPAVAGDLLTGCSLEQTDDLLQLLARFHALWWNRRELIEIPWLLAPNDELTIALAADVSAGAWQEFRHRFGEHLPPPVVEIGDRLAHDRTVLDRLAMPPHTLIHGDPRINNFMFAGDGRTVRAVLDWQTPLRGRAPMDIARLLVNNLSPDDRRVAERELLPGYHAALVSNGIRDYSYNDCWRDYRLAVIGLFGQVVVLSSLLDVDTEIGDELGPVTGTRLVVALLDLDLASLIPSPMRRRRRIARLLRGTARRAVRALGVTHR